MKSVQGLRVDARGDSQRFVQSNGRNCVAISQDVRGGGEGWVEEGQREN